MLSDYGTNFVGSRNKLNDLGIFLRSHEHEILDICSKKQNKLAIYTCSLTSSVEYGKRLLSL